MRLFQAEWLKLRRSNLIGVVIGFPLFTVILIALLQMFIMNVASHPVHPRAHFTAAQVAAQQAARAKIIASTWSWTLLFSLALRVWTIFMFPIMAMAVATVVSQAEHSTRAWSYSLTLKSPWWQVYAVKAFLILAGITISTALLMGMLFGAGGLHSLTGQPLNGTPEVKKLFEDLGLIYMGGLWMVMLQAWVGLRFQSMIPLVMLTAGLVVFEIAGMIASPMMGEAKEWMMYIPSVTPYAAFSHAPAWINAKWVGLGGGLACFVLLSLHLSRREVH